MIQRQHEIEEGGGPPETRQTEVGTLRTVLVKGPSAAGVGSGEGHETWRDLGWTASPDPEAAAREHRGFTRLLEELGARVIRLAAAPETGLDSIYVRDVSVACDRGVVLCRMGKRARRGEPAAQEAFFREHGLPVLGRIEGEGTLEGGDVVWLDERTLAVGHGYRTNEEGIRQLRVLLGDAVDELIVVPLPHWRGPDDVFHLMSVLSPVDRDLAVVYSPLLPVPFRQELLARGFELVEVPEREFEGLGCNVLATGPARCVMLEGNPITRSRLEAAGAEVHTFRGEEICLKGQGGPTCLTRPLARDRSS